MQGPRQDGGSLFDNDNPGVSLVERMYNYCGKYHPKTRVMVAGLRRKEGKHIGTYTPRPNGIADTVACWLSHTIAFPIVQSVVANSRLHTTAFPVAQG